MRRILNLVYVICLATACMSCGAREGRLPSKQPEHSVRPVALFQDALLVRDEVTVALFARLSQHVTLPSTMTLTFYDHGKLVETFTNATVQVSPSGYVYAAPASLPASQAQSNVLRADHATATIGSDIYTIDLAQAIGTISQFQGGPYYPPDAYPPCPHCLVDFLCRCMKDVKDMAGMDPLVSDKFCAQLHDPEYPCEAPEQFKLAP